MITASINYKEAGLLKKHTVKADSFSGMLQAVENFSLDSEGTIEITSVITDDNIILKWDAWAAREFFSKGRITESEFVALLTKHKIAESIKERYNRTRLEAIHSAETKGGIKPIIKAVQYDLLGDLRSIKGHIVVNEKEKQLIWSRTGKAFIEEVDPSDSSKLIKTPATAYDLVIQVEFISNTDNN